MVLERTIEVGARLRAKNQLTVPERIIEALQAEQDDTLIWEIDPAEPEVARVRRIPHDFAGSLTGVYGTTTVVIEFIRGEHDSWDE